jgi:hypothetical protein
VLGELAAVADRPPADRHVADHEALALGHLGGPALDAPVVAGRLAVGPGEARVVVLEHVQADRRAHRHGEPLALEHADVEAEARVGGGEQRRAAGERERHRVVVVDSRPADRRVVLGLQQRRDAVDAHHVVHDPALGVPDVLRLVPAARVEQVPTPHRRTEEPPVEREDDLRLARREQLPVLGRLGREGDLDDLPVAVARDVPLEVLVLGLAGDTTEPGFRRATHPDQPMSRTAESPASEDPSCSRARPWGAR